MNLSFISTRTGGSSTRRSGAEAGLLAVSRPCAWVLATAAAASACAPSAPTSAEVTPLIFENLKPASPLAPTFPPAVVTVPLSPAERRGSEGFDPLEGFLRLGPGLAASEPGFPLVLARREEAGPWNLLIVDANGDERPAGSLGAGKAGAVKSEEGRFRVTLEIDHLEGTRIVSEPYSVEATLSSPSAGAAQRHQGLEAPTEIRVSGFGYRRADVTVNGATLTVLLADGNSDGVFGEEDLWTIAESANFLAAPFTSETAREVGDFVWAAGRAWILLLDGTAGRSGLLALHDPGVTREEDGRRRKTYASDREAPRAAAPLICLGGIRMLDPEGSGAPRGPIRAGATKRGLPSVGAGGTGEEQASVTPKAGDEAGSAVAGPSQERLPSHGAVLLYFTAPRCAQCEDMERLVFPSREVAEAARETACWRVDADTRPDLLDTYRVGGVPAGVLFDSGGREVGRREGYMGVAALAALLRRAQAE